MLMSPIKHHSDAIDIDCSDRASYLEIMRTTINLEDDVLEQVKRYAEDRSVSMGKAVSDLVRRGLASPRPTKVVNGFHVVVLPSDSPAVTTEDVKKLLDEIE